MLAGPGPWRGGHLGLRPRERREEGGLRGSHQAPKLLMAAAGGAPGPGVEPGPAPPLPALGGARAARPAPPRPPRLTPGGHTGSQVPLGLRSQAVGHTGSQVPGGGS